MSMMGGAPKPYFRIENGKLALQHQPVPRRAGNHDLGWERVMFDHFCLVHYAMRRLGLLRWWVTLMRNKYELSDAEAVDVGRLLMGQLADIRDQGTRVAVVIQYAGTEVSEQSAAWESNRSGPWLRPETRAGNRRHERCLKGDLRGRRSGELSASVGDARQ
jgi:hypothetical protein